MAVIKGKNKVGESSGGGNLVETKHGKAGEQKGMGFEDGPWKEVQKQRRVRKVVDSRKNSAPRSHNDKSKIVGSCFLILENEDQVINGDDSTLNGNNMIKQGKDSDVSRTPSNEATTNNVDTCAGC
ncbi:unnamed protein product [Vicia faba]|uniref:Uncharacterized protein n=1 Tax=Vicia faba TaxID=3906 RepID=A0AAV0ZYE6_VICFA|nr:unnamed protein product [Vicia faba]